MSGLSFNSVSFLVALWIVAQSKCLVFILGPKVWKRVDSVT